MEEKIKELQEYFKAKMLKGEFRLGERIEDNWFDIVIDNNYIFTIWNTEHRTDLWYASGSNFINGIVFNQEEQSLLRIFASELHDKWKQTEGIRIKREQFNKLAEELGETLLTENNF